MSGQKRTFPFENMANRAAAIAENPMAKLAGHVFVWGFRAIVLGAIWIAGYAGEHWIDVRMDERLQSSPIIVDSARRVAAMEPVVASSARAVENIADQQRRFGDAINHLNSTLQDVDKSVASVNTSVAVVAIQMADMKTAQKETADRLDRRMDQLSHLR